MKSMKYYEINRGTGAAKACFAATHEGQLTGEEGLFWLSSEKLAEGVIYIFMWEGKTPPELK